MIFINEEPLKLKDTSFFSAIIYHKQKGELVSTKDNANRKLIYHSLGKKFSHFMPVGRLDFASEGLLILSDSKLVVQTLMESKLERTYLIKINSSISKDMIEAMENGIVLEDALKGAHDKSSIKSMSFPSMDFKIINQGKNFSKLKVTLKEGKNRELRRFFAHFNADVLDLRRVSYGFLNLNSLPSGKSRFFTRDEYKKLREFLDASSNTYENLSSNKVDSKGFKSQKDYKSKNNGAYKSNNVGKSNNASKKDYEDKKDYENKARDFSSKSSSFLGKRPRSRFKSFNLEKDLDEKEFSNKRFFKAKSSSFNKEDKSFNSFKKPSRKNFDKLDKLKKKHNKK